MQTNSISKWAALLATIGGMVALPLSIMAAPNPVTNTNLVTGGTYYTTASAATVVTVNSGSFSGNDNLILSSASPGIRTDGASSVFTGSNIKIYTSVKLDADGNPLNAGGGITTNPDEFVANNVSSHSVYLTNGSRVELSYADVRSLNNGYAVLALSNNIFIADHFNIVSQGDAAHTVYSGVAAMFS